jgi:hypothetical protein
LRIHRDDILGIDNISSCQNLCQQDIQCVEFNFQESNGFCGLFKSGCLPKAYAARVWYTCTRNSYATVTRAIEPSSYTIYTHKKDTLQVTQSVGSSDDRNGDNVNLSHVSKTDQSIDNIQVQKSILNSAALSKVQEPRPGNPSTTSSYFTYGTSSRMKNNPLHGDGSKRRNDSEQTVMNTKVSSPGDDFSKTYTFVPIVKSEAGGFTEKEPTVLSSFSMNSITQKMVDSQMLDAPIDNLISFTGFGRFSRSSEQEMITMSSMKRVEDGELMYTTKGYLNDKVEPTISHTSYLKVKDTAPSLDNSQSYTNTKKQVNTKDMQWGSQPSTHIVFEKDHVALETNSLIAADEVHKTEEFEMDRTTMQLIHQSYKSRLVSLDTSFLTDYTNHKPDEMKTTDNISIQNNIISGFHFVRFVVCIIG